MKACKFCGTQVDNNVQHCPSCGSAVFLHVCENCGNQFDSGFCPNCGVRAGQTKKICPDCGSAYFSNACPNCGYTPSRKPVVQKVEQTVVHKHVYEEAPEQETYTSKQAQQNKKVEIGCGCLTFIVMVITALWLTGNLSFSRKSTPSYTRTITATKTTARVTKAPNATAAPTKPPEPAVAAVQEKVDQYFAKADENEIAAVKKADWALNQLEAEKQGKVILVSRGWSYDRGNLGSFDSEPNYIGSLGYAAVSEDQKLEKNSDFAATPWKVPVYQKDKQFWKQTGTVDHKTEVVVIGQELEMSKRKYGNSSCSGYLHVIRMDTGKDCWLDVGNYVSSTYWKKNLNEAQEKGYCIAAFKQVSDYYPVTGANKKVELDDGTLVLLLMRSEEHSTSPDKKNNPIPAIVFKQWKYTYGENTVWFNEKDLTLTY